MKNFIANTEKKLDAWAEKLEKIDVRYPADLVTGIICLVLSIVLMVIMPQQVVISEKDVVNGRAFPTMLCYLMLAMSVLLIGKELVKLAAKELDWKKSTTYTVLKRLCERGIFQNNDGTVTSLISRKDFYAVQSEKFVEETFSGSLPAFLAAFTTRKKLSDAEIHELQELINQSRR